MSRTVPGALLAAVLAGCSPLGLVNAVVSSDGYHLEADLAYGPLPRQTLDVYRPREAASGAPVVVFFHGGSWQGGDKGDYRFVGQVLTSQGVAVVVPEYRVYPRVRFPAFVEDGAAAVRWVQRNAARFGGDADRIYLMGHSAGAHIAALLALDGSYLEAAGADRRQIRGVIALAGPYDFLPFRDVTIRELFGPPEGWPATQPINFVDGTQPPMLLLHGKNDRVVLPENTTRLAQRIRCRGGSVREILYPGIGHALILGAVAQPLQRLAPVLRDTIDFIRENERRRGES